MTPDEVKIQKAIASALELLAKQAERIAAALDAKTEVSNRTAELVLRFTERFLEGSAERTPLGIDAENAEYFANAVEELVAGSTNRTTCSTGTELAELLRSLKRPPVLAAKPELETDRCRCGHHRAKHLGGHSACGVSMQNETGGVYCGCTRFRIEAPGDPPRIIANSAMCVCEHPFALHSAPANRPDTRARDACRASECPCDAFHFQHRASEPT